MLSEIPKVIAHRGASGIVPENTISSIRRALDVGAEMVEIDVHTTKDGEIVVMHDHDVSRTTNGKGIISELTARQIRRLDAGSWFGPDFSGEMVPTLDEVLEVVCGKADLCIEIKHAEPSPVLGKVRDHDCIGHVVIFDFNHTRVYEAKRLEGSIRTLALGISHDNIDALNPDMCDAIGAAFSKVDQSLVEMVHDLNLAVFVYIVNDEAGMRDLIRFGVDGIITNSPGKALDVIRLHLTSVRDPSR